MVGDWRDFFGNFERPYFGVLSFGVIWVDIDYDK